MRSKAGPSNQAVRGTAPAGSLLSDGSSGVLLQHAQAAATAGATGLQLVAKAVAAADSLTLPSSLGLLRPVLDRLGLAYLVLAHSGTVLAGTEGAVQILDADKTGIVGRPLLPFFDAADQAAVRAAHQQAFVSNAPVVLHARRVSGQDDVTRSEFAVQLEWVAWPADDACLMLVSEVDKRSSAGAVSHELHREMGVLRESLDFAMSTLDGLSAHICVLDENATIVWANDAWRQFGQQNGAVPSCIGPGVNYLAICEGASGHGAGDAAQLAHGLREVLQGRQRAFEMEYPCHSSSEQRWFMVTVTQVPHRSPPRYIVAHQSVTSRHLAEDQLREAQKMESLGTLAGGIAHDFNNILGSILGNVALAQEEALSQPSVSLRLEYIQRASARGRDLVQQILTYSRPHIYDNKTWNLLPLLNETADLLRTTLPAGIRLEVNLARTPLFVHADPTQIQQVLMNLCTNAWHAMTRGVGLVQVMLSEDTRDPLPSANHAGSAERFAHLCVSDNGCGMDVATQARIFEPFFTTKPVGKGTGLGLSVVHGIVAAAGGWISVDSTVGVGTAFHVYLPVVDAAGALSDPVELPQDAAVRPGAGQHILCVDDDELMLLVIEGSLQRAGYKVTAVTHPEEALVLIRNAPKKFDLLFTDYNMPTMSGLDLAAQALVHAPKLPIVMGSGHISDDMLAQARNMGLHAVLRKEHLVEEMAAAVHRALHSNRTRSVNRRSSDH
jgi:signal transduction histidine kinase/ActR/RegA family two-component response regulator/PAS domain-containing protein